MMFGSTNIVTIFRTVIAFDILKTVATRYTWIRGIFTLYNETGTQSTYNVTRRVRVIIVAVEK